jgi:hypothetical protein
MIKNIFTTEHILDSWEDTGKRLKVSNYWLLTFPQLPMCYP